MTKSPEELYQERIQRVRDVVQLKTPDRVPVYTWVRANLEDHMVPQIIEFRHTLPKNASGKIRKTELV